MSDDSTKAPADHGSRSVTAGLLARYVLVFLIVASVAGLFAYAGRWLSPHALTPARMIDGFEQANGAHPGFRRNHAKGLCFTGYFDSNGNGVALSRASVFFAGRIPVIGRFALAGGQPFQADAPHTVRSMAVLFTLPSGEEWRSGMNNIPVFAVNTPQAFYDQILAFAPDPVTGKPDPEKISAFLATNPASAKAIQLIKNAPVSSGFDNSTYNSLDAFHFIDAQGKDTTVRWSMMPVQPFEPPSAAQPTQSAPNYLFDALIASVQERPLQWHLMITIGEPGDPTNDATLPWPPERKQIDVGTLTVDHVESEDASPARDINFDPLVLPSGIEPSDDPLLSARSAAYAQSFTRREGEKKTGSAVSAAEAGK
jgi:catalase